MLTAQLHPQPTLISLGSLQVRQQMLDTSMLHWMEVALPVLDQMVALQV